MNDVIRCLLTRRSVKKYRAEQVEEEKLEQILQAGSYAACGMGGSRRGRSSCCRTRRTLRSSRS